MISLANHGASLFCLVANRLLNCWLPCHIPIQTGAPAAGYACFYNGDSRELQLKRCQANCMYYCRHVPLNQEIFTAALSRLIAHAQRRQPGAPVIYCLFTTSGSCHSSQNIVLAHGFAQLHPNTSCNLDMSYCPAVNWKVCGAKACDGVPNKKSNGECMMPPFKNGVGTDGPGYIDYDYGVDDKKDWTCASAPGDPPICEGRCSLANNPDMPGNCPTSSCIANGLGEQKQRQHTFCHQNRHLRAVCCISVCKSFTEIFQSFQQLCKFSHRTCPGRGPVCSAGQLQHWCRSAGIDNCRAAAYRWQEPQLP
jgi:hypothetical protein